MSFHTNFADHNQMIHFLKNVMMAGGLLQIAAFGGGALSIDNRRKTRELGFKPCGGRLNICDGVLARSLDLGLQAPSRKPLSKTPMVLALYPSE